MINDDRTPDDHDADEAVAEVTAVAAAHAEQVDTDGIFPVDSVAALRASGLLGLVISEDAGGMGAGPAEFIEVIGSIAAACGSTAMIYLMHIAAAVTVASAPPAAMPDLLSRMASGEVLGTLAFSEKGSRSHFWAPVSESVVDGDDLRFTADKSWVTSVGYADVYVMSSKSAVDPETVDLYAIPSATAGLEIAGPWSGLGLRGNASSPMSVSVAIPSSYRIGEAGSGFGTMMATVLPWFNLGNSAVSLGLSRAAVDAATTHVTGARLQHLDQALSALPTGDTGRSELDAIDAVLAGDADVAAIGITVWENLGRGELMPGMLEPVWQTETYSHCMFTALDTLPESVYAPWVAKLRAMDWNVPAHRRILELEGLTKWVEPHLEGYTGLFEAIEKQGVDARW